MSVSDQVLRVIREVPGAEAGDIVELLPGCNEMSVRSALSVLAQQKKVERTATRRKGSGRKTYAYRPRSISAPTPPVEARPHVATPKVSVASLRGRLSAAEEELAGLRQWKAEALERYPDLRVRPEVLEARKIVAHELAKNGDKVRAADVTAGRADGSILMRAVVAALETRN